ncbi:MAG: DMT family transporter [Chamaesiphon sp.]
MPLHQSSGRWRLGLALSLLVVLLWGILPIALTVTLQTLDIYTVTWFRFLVAFVLLGVYLAVRQQLPEPQKLRSMSLKLIAIAIIFLAINYLLFLQGLGQTSPSNAEVLIQLAPVSMGLGALAVFKERYVLRQWIGLGVLSLGFILFFHEQLTTLIAAPTKYLIGSGILVVAGVAWAIYALAQKQLLQTLPSSNIMFLIYGSCTLLFSPVAKPQLLLTQSPLSWGMLLFCALNTVIAYGAFAESLEHWEASRVSAVIALAPIVTLISMWAISLIAPNLVTPEHITALGLVGAILVVLGCIAIALGKKADSKLRSTM